VILYYIDTCIWLNLFKQEGDPSKGIPYWKIAKEFIDKVGSSNEKHIVYSGFVLRELEIKLEPLTYAEKRKYLSRFEMVDVNEEDKINARKLESHYNFDIGFYDLLHLSLCKRLGLILITRDAALMIIAKEQNVAVSKPENS